MDYKEFIDELTRILFDHEEEIIDDSLLDKILEKVRRLEEKEG